MTNSDFELSELEQRLVHARDDLENALEKKKEVKKGLALGTLSLSLFALLAGPDYMDQIEHVPNYVKIIMSLAGPLSLGLGLGTISQGMIEYFNASRIAYSAREELREKDYFVEKEYMKNAETLRLNS